MAEGFFSAGVVIAIGGLSAIVVFSFISSSIWSLVIPIGGLIVGILDIDSLSVVSKTLFMVEGFFSLVVWVLIGRLRIDAVDDILENILPSESAGLSISLILLVVLSSLSLMSDGNVTAIDGFL